MAHETKSTHRPLDCSWLRNVSTSKTKLPEELGVVMTTAAQIKPPTGGLFFGWTEFKMHYHCCEFKMAVFSTHQHRVKMAANLNTQFLMCYTFMSVVIFTKTNSCQYGRIIGFIGLWDMERRRQQHQVG